jgi:peptidoglycan/LPS O-acetylase OafA/YrhL
MDGKRLPLWQLVMHRPYLDALRGIAILLVISVHAGIAGHGPELIKFGQRGVQLFYLLSAFTLCLSMRTRATTAAPRLTHFYIRRFWRIAPMFYLAFAANIYLTAGANLGQNPLFAIIATLTFGHALFPDYINTTVIGGWSVGVEFSFYALFPLIYRYLTTTRRTVYAVLVALLVCWQIDQLLANALPARREYFQFLWPVAELPVFLMGFLAFHLREELAARLSSAERKRAIRILALTIPLLIWASLPTSNRTLYVSALAFVPALIILSFVPAPWIVNRASTFLGRISYSAYLIHFFVLLALERSLPAIWPAPVPVGMTGFALYLVPTVLITALLSWGTWRWVEQPGIAIGQAWISRLRIHEPVSMPTKSTSHAA